MCANYKSIILAISLFFSLSASISAAPGDLDPTFGSGGRVITRGNNPNHLNEARAMAIPTEGKIIVLTPIPTPSPTLRANGKIAFTSDRDGNPEIYVMDPDGTNQIRITNNNIVDDHPMWSPDGMKLAFVSQRPTGGFAIFQMNMDGTNRVEITPLSDFVNTPPWGVIGFSMSWSPDGRKIAFQEPFLNDIFVVDLETHVRQNLTNDGGVNFGQLDFHPAWSPDGTTILFASPRFNGACPSLYAINPDGTNRRLLTGNHCPAYSPSWSPDGTKIVFLQLNGELFESELRIANSDGTNVRILDGGHPDTRNRDYPRWSPDGRKIAFNMTDNPNSGDIEIYERNIDGTGFAQLTNTPAGRNYRPSWQPLQAAACPNPIDCPDFFVRQHYRDFLSREPDSPGLDFWTNEITLCGSDLQCVEAKRINVSAAFFLSIEFQEGGYLVYRFYKSAFGNLAGAPVPVRLNDFLPDAQQIGKGLIVNQPGWQTVLENNKQAFATSFVQRPQFASLYSTSMSPAGFVDTLFANAGVIPTSTDRAAAINEFGGASTTADVAARARALRRVAENSTLAQQEFNRAFVLMQYFGYLRRNPNDAPDGNFDGSNFWLDKLNQFNGNFIQAEMVKAFLVSTEYRQRFGSP
jgi:Tol biopolymer transport system component